MPSTSWYPQNKKELNEMLEKFLSQPIKTKIKKIHGIIAPHAGYEYSGAVAGKAYSLLKNLKDKKAIVFGPSHYANFSGISEEIGEEHSINNQIPFLKKLGFKEIKKIMVSQLNFDESKKIAEKFSKEKNTIFIFSTDLSHFFPYELAVKMDKETIKKIENLHSEELNPENACGYFPLLILIELCKIKKWKPELVEYKNSGDITGEKSSVVGYAGFIF